MGVTEQGGVLPAPPNDPDREYPSLNHFTMAWNRDLRCGYNLAAGDLFMDACLDSEYRPLLLIVSSTVDEPERNLGAIAKALMGAFWTRIEHLYAVNELHPHPDFGSLVEDEDRSGKRKASVSP